MEQKKIEMSPEDVKVVNEIIHRRNQAEIKVEQGQIAVIEIRRKKAN